MLFWRLLGGCLRGGVRTDDGDEGEGGDCAYVRVGHDC